MSNIRLQPSENNFDEQLEVAKEVALKAGALLQEYSQNDFNVSYKGTVDLVTEADIASEKLVTEELKKHFPAHEILSEESAGEKPETDYLWVVDPLDGTTNFAHRFPIYAVSIGLLYKDEPVVGVVYEPNLSELFSAVKNNGAYLNDQPIKVSGVTELEQALLATGFPYDTRQRPDTILGLFNAFALRSQGVRRAGAASIDICYTACGRFDGFWEQGLKPWDTAAAALILTEAGGKTTKYDNSPFDIWIPEMLASNGQLHEQMLEVLKNS